MAPTESSSNGSNSSSHNQNSYLKERKNDQDHLRQPAIKGKAGEQVWDTSTQQYHAGQDWAVLDTFIEDYSVTTNAL
ncbi:hypothetical protein EV182_004084, partial [Spiromyces aspiralis]